MKKTLLALFVVLLIPLWMTACSAGDTQEDTAAEPAEASQDVKDYSNGTPWPDIDLNGVVTEEMPADVKDNFALYANKDDILSLKIPADHVSAGTMEAVMREEEEDTRRMFEGSAPKSHDAKLAFDLYHMMMDWDSRNKRGVAPLKEETDKVEAIDSMDELTAYITNTPQNRQLGMFWFAGAGPDLEDSERNVIQVSNNRLLLVDSAEYRELTDYGKVIKDAKMKLAKRMLIKLGYTEDAARKKIDNALAFEGKMAVSILTGEEKRSEDYYSRANNHFTRAELKKAEGKLPILELLDKTGYPKQDDYVVTQPDFLKTLNDLYTEENLEMMRDTMIVKGVIQRASDLDRECYDWSNDCADEIEGVDQEQDDETFFAESVSGMMKWPVAQLYTENYLKKEDKERISEIVEEIKDAYHGILEDADFLSDETREKAIEKLEAIEPRVLYPDSWEKYSCEGLDFKGPDEGGMLWEALQKLEDWELDEEVEEFTAPVDKEIWAVTPQTFNCSYDPHSNCMYILGAYARGGIYNSEMSDEEVLAKLGISIGHEISHAFDRTGAQFDKNGNMKNWWTDEDKAEFKKRNARLAEYYDNIHPWEGQNLKGKTITGEACADMAGMKVVLKIAEKKKDFDYDKFFRAFANLWLTKENLQMAWAHLENEHPMNYLRINCTLQQYDEFLDQYGITEGDTMYLAPEDRVNIW